ncbi:MAG: aspartate 1-decarboxylase [Verrucomicrobiales bacterium]|jgi:aspartate 1-decarboxylase
MLRSQLKSKIHRAIVTDAHVDYEGSISIPEDLMEASGLWEGEKVLVASITSGNRLETYVQRGPAREGAIVMNGGAARLIQKGERVAIMAFALSAEPIQAKKLLCNERNEVIRVEDHC